MAAPTQAYPSWLTPSPYETTFANGDIGTATTILYLPLTYYGPSIPLDGAFTYGGLTSPASTATDSTSTSPATPSTSSSSAPTSSAIPSFSSPSSTSSLSSIIPSSTTSAPSSPTSSDSSSNGHFALHGGQLAGLIIGIVLAVIFFVILAYCLYHHRKNRPLMKGHLLTIRQALSRLGSQSDLPKDQAPAANPPGYRSPGEGSPRQSGEEADPFLTRSRYTHPDSTASSDNMAEMGSVPTSWGIAYAGNTGSSSSTDLGEINYNSHLTALARGEPLQAPYVPPPGPRRILSPEEQRKFDTRASTIEEVQEPSEDSPLMPPPRLVDPGPSLTAPESGSLPLSRRSFHSNSSSLPLDADEAGMLQTARRVNLEDELGVRASVPANLVASPPRDSSSWLPTLGLAGLANIGRLSWFKSSEPNSRRSSANVPPSAWSGHGMVDRDVESGQPLLTAPSAEFRSSRGIIGVGLGPGGERPHSGAQSSVNTQNSGRSGNSGNTLYHDAMSSMPELPPPVARSGSGPTTPARSSPLTHPTPLADNSGAPADVLDAPAPPPLHNFASSSSMRDTATTNSSVASKKGPAYPPGLVPHIPFLPKAWTQTEGTTPTPGSYAGTAEIDPNARTSVTIDVLEEEPPMAQHGFARIVNFNLPSLLPGAGRRTTFGGPGSIAFGHSPEHSSEHGSLHSDVGGHHLSPSQSRSVGSSASQSGSSRRSRRTGSSSLSHSGSISSDGRRRGKLGVTNRSTNDLPPMPMSPALSAVGERTMSPPMSAPVSPGALPSRALSPLDEHRPTSPNSVSRMPWATGLDDTWNAS